MQIYECSSYREYIKAKIYVGKRAKKGALSSLAAAIPCQVSYLSRVMKESAELSLEQADRVAQYFGLSSDEGYFFLLLVQLARSGTPTLRAQFQARIDVEIEERLNLQKRAGVKQSIRIEDQATYYSQWYYAALHVMSGIPALQNKEAMSERIGLPLARVTEILQFLISIGLINQIDDRFVTGVGRLHLKKNSPMIQRHHANWRIQAIRNIEKRSDDGIHYSVLVNTSKTDAQLLRSKIAQFIEQFMQVVHPSSDEVMSCFNMDFFEPEA